VDLLKMKINIKYLNFITIILLLPIVSYNYARGQNKSDPTHEERIEKFAHFFFPIFCNETFPKTVNLVQNCYKISPENNSSTEYCLIVDKYLIDIAQHNKQFKNIYPINTTDFINGYKMRLITSFIMNAKFIYYNLNSYNLAINNNAIEFSKNITALYHKYDPKQDKCLKNDFSQYSNIK